MFQSILFWYFLFIIIYLFAFNSVTDFKRFFAFSETVWLVVFMLLIGLNLFINNSLININVFFILVFTACEAVVMASLLLLISEINPINLLWNQSSL